jgi:hypothetical protein
MLQDQEVRCLIVRYKALGSDVRSVAVKVAKLLEQILWETPKDRLNDLDEVAGILDAALSMYLAA